MSFKVVIIKETKEVEPVPHLWENDGKLLCPSHIKSTAEMAIERQQHPR